MELPTYILDVGRPLLPTLLTLALFVAVLIGLKLYWSRQEKSGKGSRYRRQLASLLLGGGGALLLVLALPLSATLRGQILSLIGIVLSAAIALSSTTFLGNALAGIMLRTLRNFRTGDFIHAGDQFGKVSHRGLFHTEIQTEYRDLTTLPNLYLVTNPVRVIRTSGTILSARVSLGYDVPRAKVEKLLAEAAEAAGLESPFVLVDKLGDFSVTYRAAGLCTSVKQILSKRAELRARMMDRLHGGGIEIVSPTFMNQRSQPLEKRFVPRGGEAKPADTSTSEKLEKVVFDKADAAESIERLQEMLREMAEEIEKLTESAKEAKDPELAALKTRIEQLSSRRERLAELIKTRKGTAEE